MFILQEDPGSSLQIDNLTGTTGYLDLRRVRLGLPQCIWPSSLGLPQCN